MQRGLLRWVLSLHQPDYRIEVSPKKLPDPTADPRKANDSTKPRSTPAAKSKKPAKNGSASTAEINSDQEVEPVADELPTLNGPAPATSRRLRRAPVLPPEDVSSSLPSAAAATATPGALGLPSIPPPLTPSVTQVLSRAPDAPPPPPLPAGLTVASLKSRLNGKNKVKYVLLARIRVSSMLMPKLAQRRSPDTNRDAGTDRVVEAVPKHW